jgi:hypothetical protein
MENFWRWVFIPQFCNVASFTLDKMYSRVILVHEASRPLADWPGRGPIQGVGAIHRTVGRRLKNQSKPTIFMINNGLERIRRNRTGEAKNQTIENREVRLMQVGSGPLTQKDVKNEGRTDYVYENTGESDKMYTARPT